MTDAELITRYFRGRADYVAAPGDGTPFEPKLLTEPMRPEWLASEHLSGNRCLGFYLMSLNNTVLATCVDFDNKPEKPDPLWKSKAEQVYYLLANAGLTPVVEVSQSGTAAHVWLFCAEPTEAWIVRGFWRAVSAKLDVPFVEVYPRQERVTGKGFGNLVRYPLWNLGHFADVDSDWESLDVAAALGNVRTMNGAELKLLAFELGGGVIHPETPVEVTTGDATLPARVKARIANEHSLLSKRWRGDMEGMKDASRSALVQSIACELVRTYVPTPEVEQAVRHWCNENNYDKGNRDQWISDTVRKAYDFVVSRVEQKATQFGTFKDASLEYVAKLRNGVPLCIAPGLRDLEHSIDGVGPGEMCVLAARPSHGKTAFAMQWCDTAAYAGLPCLFISEEMGRLEIGKRSLLSISRTPENDWSGVIDSLELEIVTHHVNRAPLYLVENCHTIDRVEELIDQYCSIYGVKLVAVDYLQLLGSRHLKRYDSVTDISRRLKQAARRNDCGLLALCQLNREVEKRPGHNPQLSDLRESGQIEQDADLVLMLQWPVKIDPKADANEYRVYCVKRRNGPIRQSVVVTSFNPHRQLFGNVQLAGGAEWDASAFDYKEITEQEFD